MHSLNIYHWDVDSAFLQGEVDEELYLEKPEDFLCSSSENKVYKLKKSIYGLKQDSKAWNATLDNYLKTLVLKQPQFDLCVYFIF